MKRISDASDIKDKISVASNNILFSGNQNISGQTKDDNSTALKISTSNKNITFISNIENKKKDIIAGSLDFIEDKQTAQITGKDEKERELNIPIGHFVSSFMDEKIPDLVENDIASNQLERNYSMEKILLKKKGNEEGDIFKMMDIFSYESNMEDERKDKK